MSLPPSSGSGHVPGRPPLRPFGVVDLPAPDADRSAACDRAAIEDLGVPQRVLMENAGRAAAAVLQRLAPRGRVVVVVGRGHNGGDGVVTARTLAAAGREVRLVLVGRDGGDDPLLHHHPVERTDGAALEPEAWQAVLAEADVVVDALLGTGITGAPREPQASAVRAIGASGRPVLALDVPSGVDASSGAVPGPAVRARWTVAFGWPKLGALLHPGRGYAGRLVAVDIGFPPFGVLERRTGPEPVARLITPGWAAAAAPRREAVTHKNRVGALLVLAGSSGMAGAAVLATRAALRAGTGMVRIASPAANRTVLQAAAPEAVFVDADAADGEALAAAVQSSSAVAAGPGMGTDEGAERRLRTVLEAAEDRPVVLDADALNLLAAGRPWPTGRVARERPLLLTPHPGEMARLTGRPGEEVGEDRPAEARDFAVEMGCALLLKGSPSVVAAPDGGLFADTAGSSAVATAGMGDTLTGATGALLAQGLPPAEAGALALWLTGRAAVLAGGHGGVGGVLPTDVAEHLPPALRELSTAGPGDSDLDLPFVLFDQDEPR